MTKKFDDMSICLDTVPALDRQTDRQTDRRTDGWKCHNNIALCMHFMLTHDKNKKETKQNTVQCNTVKCRRY